ncbi:LacI family DNA-binding transcriptional regulator [Bacillus sp. FJAT-49711]|uniref:LacI family DNA-binding transcriptional regulator n=1 Tax=Bacillus sp. FJAT-49711 TaxID=2833585 RepID=UPI001BC9F662|nr:LacI family DNA-binding transcriptional regulator [Bacillus sp. FJAT-49711]MBS4217520.1 LacI family DNA-binding transcriptional regulator [Bacillus sp. FJAT-49711]
MITILDIAKMANVSRTTVSRVLNNTGYVSEEARERVMKVIKETGYVPSQQAKSLRTKETKVVGVILPRISTETSSKVLSGIDEVLSEHGYQILLAITNLQIEKEIEYVKLLANRQVDGIILVATNVQQELIKEIDNLKLPFVVIGQNMPGISSVYYDDYHAAKSLTHMLLNKDKKNIAFIGVHETDQAVGILRKEGYVAALKENHIPLTEKSIEIGSFHLESGYECMKKIIENNQYLPDAVFAATDRIAIGAMSYLQEKNIRIPEDMSIVSIGTSELSKYISPKLTTIDYENEKAGKAGAEILYKTMKGGELDKKKIVLNYRIIEGDTL